MGGLGSGRRWHNSATGTTNDYRAIDVRRWHQKGLLKPGGAFGWQWFCDDEMVASIQVRLESASAILSYCHRSGGGDWTKESYPVLLDWTPCNLGGQRPWFCCPARGCGRRVAVLYGGAIFACRQCYKLAYPSQRESAYDRAARRADRIRERLCWEPGILNGAGLKPIGMHWRTFEKLVAEHHFFVGASLAGFAERFGSIF